MAYADTDELFRILKIRNPSDAQEAAADRVLEMAAFEIDTEIDLAADSEISDPGAFALLETVNLKRAGELWEYTPFGMFAAEGFSGSERTARDPWTRYANMLAPLKDQQGFA
jgi:hypothetical protein